MLSVDVRDRVLILNGSHAEIPLILAAQKLNFEVVTTGLLSDGQGHTLADRYVPADFSDSQAILEIARDLQVVGIVAGCNDFAAITAARVAQIMKLPGHDDLETTLVLHHKDRFRALMKELCLPAINARAVRDFQEARDAFASFGGPVMVKPVDLTGGKGMSMCRDASELATAVDLAFAKTRSEHVIIEQYVEGSHHGFSCFIENQQVRWWFADDEQYFLNPFLVAGTSCPTSLSKSEIEAVFHAAESIASHLGLIDGLLHLQVVSSDDRVFVLEACRRCPGDLYPEFVRLATDWDYAKAVLQSELGMKVSMPSHHRRVRHVVRHCAMASHGGNFEGIEIAEAIRNRVVNRFAIVEPGSAIVDHWTQKPEILFLEFDSQDEMRAHLRERESDIVVAVEDASREPSV